MSNIHTVKNRNVREINDLLNIWESAVTATHLFLSEDDIKAIKPEVVEGLKEIEHLYCYFVDDTAYGFIGVANNKIEMLFIDDKARGKGIGKKLIRFAVDHLDAKYVDVNEQNDQGIGFYKHMGFHIIGRSELDEQGRPFPILHLKLRDSYLNYYLTNRIKEDDALRRSYNSLAEKTFGMSFEEFYQNGYWTDKYLPYSLIDDGKVIANASVNIIKSHYNGQVKRCIQIGTIMTDPDYRNQGLSRYLIERIIREWKDKCDIMYLFANDHVLDFYPKFGFIKAVEYQCSSPVTPTKGHVRKLDMSRAIDRELLKRYYTKSNPYSALTMEDNYELLMFYCSSSMKDCVYFLEDFDAVIIASNKNEILTCYDIFGNGDHALIDMVSKVAELQVRTVVFGFTPAKHAAFHSQILKEEDTTLYILKEKDNWFENNQMMFPSLSHA